MFTKTLLFWHSYSTFLTSSLYGNAIADIGAEHLALALPEMKVLQDLE